MKVWLLHAIKQSGQSLAVSEDIMRYFGCLISIMLLSLCFSIHQAQANDLNIMGSLSLQYSPNSNHELVSNNTSSDSVVEEEEEEVVNSAQSATDISVVDEQASKPQVDVASNAFVIVGAILVIIMSVPGIGLFYGGLVRAKNIMSVLEQCLIVFALCMLLWLVIGYSWAFGSSSVDSWYGQFIGGFEKFLLLGISVDSVSGVLSEYTFIIFQGAFCAISACLIVGALVERVRFVALLVGIGIWAVLSYFPLAHMVWGNGFIEQVFHAYDFAGGTVVHINAAVAALIAAKLLGARVDLHKMALTPHSLPLTYIGCGLLWIGWFGFNAASQLTSDGVSSLAFANTVFAPAAAAIVWMISEKILSGKASTLGSASGVLAGLVAITPACAFVGPLGGIVIGSISSLVCLWGVRGFKRLTKIDDSLDVFGIHGLGAIVGALLTGVFCSPSLGGTGFKGDYTSILGQFYGQLGSVVVAIVWSGIVALIAFYLAGKLTGGLRAELDEERMGLDLAAHGERGYNM